MIARVAALFIALSVGATGILPVGDGYRCVAMNKRMAPGASCCPKCEAPELSLGKPCCELVRGASLQVRASRSVEQPRLQPAPLAAILPLPIVVDALTATARLHGSSPRGRPPGERLHQLSQVLRV